MQRRLAKPRTTLIRRVAHNAPSIQVVERNQTFTIPSQKSGKWLCLGRIRRPIFTAVANSIGKRLITQQAVADAVGLHYSTISLALRNDPRLPQKTRERVQAAARRLGYTPNPLVSLLMARVRRGNVEYRGTLAYVHTLPASLHRPGHVDRNFRAGATRRAGELGYQLDHFNLAADPREAASLTRVLQARNITGVIVHHSPSPSCPGHELPFDLAPFAAVSIGVPVMRPALHYVANDQYMRPVVAARELLARGYRRPGLVIKEPFDVYMAHRCSAGFWAVQQYGPDLEAVPILRLNPARDRAPLERWLEQHRPDVVLGTDGAILELIELTGTRVPQDIGWAHLDRLPSHAPSAGVYGNSEYTGAAAVEIVVSQLHRGEIGPPPRPASHLVAGSWVDGSTVRQVGPARDFNAAFFANVTAAPGIP